MIRKLRWKVIGIIMAMATVLLAAVFSSMYVAAEQNYRRRSEEAIRTARWRKCRMGLADRENLEKMD